MNAPRLHLSLLLAGAIVAAPASAMAQSRAIPATPGVGTARAAMAGAPRDTLDDATIIAIFDAANTWDIETGALAASRGSTPAVREFGAMLQRDHHAVRQQGRDLAAKLQVTPTPPGPDFALAKNHVAAMQRLAASRGTAFDRAFLEHEVAFHKAVIDAVTSTLLPAVKSEEFRALVTKVAPAFQAHMMAAQRLLDQQRRAAPDGR